MEETTVVDLWRTVWRWKWLILLLVAGAGGAAFAISRRMPSVFRAEATCLPPETTLRRTSNAMADATRFMPYGAYPTSSTYVIVALLRSRTMREDAARRFDLAGAYGSEREEDALERLNGATNVLVSKEGVISVSVEDEDPARAAALADFHIENLDSMNDRLQMTPERPVVKKLDRAVVPHRRIRPNTRVNTLVAAAAAALAGVFLSFLIEHVAAVRRARSPAPAAPEG